MSKAVLNNGGQWKGNLSTLGTSQSLWLFLRKFPIGSAHNSFPTVNIFDNTAPIIRITNTTIFALVSVATTDFFY